MKFNKMAACLVATACTATVFGAMTSVSAADSLTIKAGSASASKAGEKFTIDIELAGVPSSGIAGLDFAVKYDSSVFKVTGYKEGAVSNKDDKTIENITSNLATNIADGEVSVLWATGQISSNATWIKSDGVLLTLECEALKEGESKVEITKGTRKDATSIDAVVEGLKVVNPSAAAGTVKIAPEATPTTEPTVAPTAEPTTKVELGDVNCDGKVDISDLSTLAMSLVNDEELTGAAKVNADVDKNGAVELADLARIKQFVSHVIEKF